MTQPRGEVFDLGYQHYDGPREGRMRARKALWLNGVRTALGLGRGSLAKVLPILLFVAVMIPAVVAILIASVADFGEDIVDHSDYYRFVSVILVLFSAIIAPELLCSDRRDGVINLYLVRPLTTTDYVAGRWLAFFSATLALVLFGQVVLLIGLVLAAEEPLDYFRDNWLDIPRFLLGGIVVAVFTTTLPLAVSAFTTRRAYAAVFVIAVFLISIPVGEILSECVVRHSVVVEQADEGREEVRESSLGAEGRCEPRIGETGKWLALITIPQVPMHVNDLIFDVEPEERTSQAVEELPDMIPVGWYMLLMAGAGFALWWRYQRIKL